MHFKTLPYLINLEIYMCDNCIWNSNKHTYIYYIQITQKFVENLQYRKYVLIYKQQTILQKYINEDC